MVASLIRFSNLFLVEDAVISVSFSTEIALRIARTSLDHDFGDAYAEMNFNSTVSVFSLLPSLHFVRFPLSSSNTLCTTCTALRKSRGV